MNTLVELLNLWGGRFIDAAWPMLWQSAVLIAVVFALDRALRKRVRAATRYALWLLVLAKLVVPASLSLPTGVAYWLPVPKTSQPSVASSLRLDNDQHAAPALQPDAASSQWLEPSWASSTTSTKSTTSTAAPTLHWRGLAALFWLAGMAALSGVLAFRARLTLRMIAAATATDDFSVLLAQCASRLGMQDRAKVCSVGALRRFPGRVTLKLSGSAPVPVVCRLFRPVILLPSALVSRLSAAQLEAVLLHELAHVRRGDPWVNYAQALLQIFYFYNPLLWLANAAIRRTREEAVDELVLVALADEAPLYPETLLQVAKFSMQTPRPGFGWVGILEKKSTVGGRIRLMLHRPWPKSARLGIRGGLAVLALAAVLLPMKSRPQQENSPVATLYHDILQKHETEISRSCGTAMTNTMRELQTLTQQYPLLGDIDLGDAHRKGWSITTMDHFPPFRDIGSAGVLNGGLSYYNNVRYVTKHIESPRAIDVVVPELYSGGMLLELEINTYAGESPDKLTDQLLLLVGNYVGFYYKYDLKLNPPDPALEKAVKDIVEKQVGILRKTLQQIIGIEPAPQRAQTSVSAPSASPEANPETAQAALPKAAPVMAAGVEDRISSPEQETVLRTLEKLSDINSYALPMRNYVVSYGLPLNTNQDGQDGDTIEAIMSNRSFRQALADLGGMDKSKASQIVGRQLSNAVTAYLPLYADETRILAERFKLSDIDYSHSRGGLSFAIGTPDGHLVLLGARLDVLSLVWISGLLELHDLKQQVGSVASLALKQRDEMYAANSVDPLAREQMLFEASLYNRQILGYALLGVAGKSSAHDTVLAKSKLDAKERVLPTIEAGLHEYSQGTVTVRYLSPATDAAFDDLSRGLMALP